MAHMAKRLSLFLVVSILLCFCLPFYAAAEGDMDGVGAADTAAATGETAEAGGDGGIGEYMKGYNPVSDRNMEEASQLASPLVNAIGTIIGIIVVITSAGIFLITALDLAYIGIPFTRPLLTMRWQLVSDEALACAPGAQMQQGGMGGMGGMNGGMGGMSGGMGMGGMHGGMGMSGGMGMGGMSGGMGMGGMQGGMGGMQGQQQGTRSCILAYFKKRVFFIIIFSIATILLLSSLFMDCGINLAALLTKIINRFNGSVSSM